MSREFSAALTERIDEPGRPLSERSRRRFFPSSISSRRSAAASRPDDEARASPSFSAPADRRSAKS